VEQAVLAGYTALRVERVLLVQQVQAVLPVLDRRALPEQLAGLLVIRCMLTRNGIS
jgi:hypothetical protein